MPLKWWRNPMKFLKESLKKWQKESEEEFLKKINSWIPENMLTGFFKSSLKKPQDFFFEGNSDGIYEKKNLERIFGGISERVYCEILRKVAGEILR